MSHTTEKPPFRYGKEYEGSHFGKQTLILPCAEDHDVNVVYQLLSKRKAHAEHLWIETQPGERFNWFKVEQLLKAGYLVTAQVRHDDLPPRELICDRGLSVVWMVPPAYHDVVMLADWIKVVHGPGPFDGLEISTKQRRSFPSGKYVSEDEVWQR